MALLRVFQSISNDVWALNFVNDPKYLGETDKKLMAQFGEPEIEMGGVFLEGEETEFTLPTKKARIRSDFPFTQEFDSTDSQFSSATQTKVEAYRDEIVTRFTDALETLRASQDNFVGEKTYQV